jgi:hypothetical protein
MTAILRMPVATRPCDRGRRRGPRCDGTSHGLRRRVASGGVGRGLRRNRRPPWARRRGPWLRRRDQRHARHRRAVPLPAACRTRWAGVRRRRRWIPARRSQPIVPREAAARRPIPRGCVPGRHAGRVVVAAAAGPRRRRHRRAPRQARRQTPIPRRSTAPVIRLGSRRRGCREASAAARRGRASAQFASGRVALRGCLERARRRGRRRGAPRLGLRPRRRTAPDHLAARDRGHHAARVDGADLRVAHRRRHRLRRPRAARRMRHPRCGSARPRRREGVKRGPVAPRRGVGQDARRGPRRRGAGRRDDPPGAAVKRPVPGRDGLAGSEDLPRILARRVRMRGRPTRRFRWQDGEAGSTPSRASAPAAAPGGAEAGGACRLQAWRRATRQGRPRDRGGRAPASSGPGMAGGRRRRRAVRRRSPRLPENTRIPAIAAGSSVPPRPRPAGLGRAVRAW